MKKTTTVQPTTLGGGTVCEEGMPRQLSTLVQSGADEKVVKDLYFRLTGGVAPADKYAEASVQSFLDTVVAFTQSGCHLTPVC